MLGAEQYSDFMKEFTRCQEQMFESIFRIQYNKLKQDWPTTVSCLDEQFGANTQYWAAYSQDRFTTGVVSTQRGVEPPLQELLVRAESTIQGVRASAPT